MAGPGQADSEAETQELKEKGPTCLGQREGWEGVKGEGRGGISEKAARLDTGREGWRGARVVAVAPGSWAGSLLGQGLAFTSSLI